MTSASETLQPATGVAQGSQAVPQSGYRFDRWVNAAGETVSTSEAFTPNKVNGINVAATYTAHFARRGDLQYEVHYFYEDPTNSSRYLENEALRRNETQAPYKAIRQAPRRHCGLTVLSLSHTQGTGAESTKSY